MKKLLAILLAAMMVFALAACDIGDDPNPSGSNNPGTSQNDTPGGTENQGGENNNGGEESGTKTFSWPTADYIKNYMKYNGAGEIVFVKEDADYGGHPATWVYINGVTLAEIETYLSAVKAEGFAYHATTLEITAGEGEPTVEFGGWDSSFSWNGQLEGTGYIGLKIYENANTSVDYVDDEQVEYTYNLKLFITTGTAEQGKVFAY